MVQGSATLNIPALAMVFFVFTPLLGFSRLILAVIGALVIGPIVVMAVRKSRGDLTVEPEAIEAHGEQEMSPWMPALTEAFRDWAKSSIGYLVRLGPIMIVAGFASGLVIQWISRETVSTYLGNDVMGVAIAATFGILINVPLLFEIPLVALLLLLGMGTAPAATLLFAAAAGGPITFWGLAKVMSKRAIATFAAATWTMGALGGLAILGISAFTTFTGLPMPGLRAEITTVAGIGVQGFSGDRGPATEAGLDKPMDVAVDDAGNLFIADAYNDRIRKVDAQTGVITTVAGGGGQGFSGDGMFARDAELNHPKGIAVDRAGNLFIADNFNSRIRRVDAQTGIIDTVAGNDGIGFSGDGGRAASASLALPIGVDVDGQGNLLIADTDSSRIRRVDSQTWVITTVAGTGKFGFGGDGGPATSASLNEPRRVAVDDAGNLFIADTFNHRIRRVDAQTGVITTVAGNGRAGFSGDGGPATSASLNNPRGVAVDSTGNLFIADMVNQRIRKVDAQTGVITTVPGIKLASPVGLAVDGAGNLFIVDFGTSSIRRVNITR